MCKFSEVVGTADCSTTLGFGLMGREIGTRVDNEWNVDFEFPHCNSDRALKIFQYTPPKLWNGLNRIPVAHMFW